MYFKRLFFFVAFMIGFAACKQQKETHLPKPLMEKVLLDLQLAEVYSTMANKDSAQNQGLKNNDSLGLYYKEVLTHHQVTASQFTQSLDWYRAHPDELDTLYNRSLRTLDATLSATRR